MKKMLIFLLAIISLLYLFPIAHTLTNSFMSEAQISSTSIEIIPEQFNLQQYYILALYKGEYFKFFFNSLKLTSVIIVGQIVIGLSAAFAFAKMKFTGDRILFIIYVLALLLPFQVTLVPNYLIFDVSERILHVKILDTHLSILLPGIFSSFGVYMLRQFVRGIPDEIIEAARIDGAGYGRILFKIIFPMIKPAVYALVVLIFIDNWNMIEQAVIFLNSPDNLPLSVFLETIFNQDYGVFYAGATLYMVPALIILIKGEKYLREGLAIGGLKHEK